MPQARPIEISVDLTFPRGSSRHLWEAPLGDFLASPLYSAAVNDLTLSRGHVALFRTARDGVACRSAPDRDTHSPSPRGANGQTRWARLTLATYSATGLRG
eukprot:3039285-Pleurochrysis_carterae.AAC.1